MRTEPIHPRDLQGVFPVPPLARKNDGTRAIDFAENDRILSHMVDGGITRFLYGGNAFLYHISLSEYEQLLDWLSGASDDLWMIPSAGPSFGRLIDQAAILRRYKFPCVMALPCGDPRDAGRPGAWSSRVCRESVDSAGSVSERREQLRRRQDGRPRCGRSNGGRRNVCLDQVRCRTEGSERGCLSRGATCPGGQVESGERHR